MADLDFKSRQLNQLEYRFFMAQLLGDYIYETKDEVVISRSQFPVETDFSPLDEGTCSFTALSPTFAELDAQLLAVEQQLTSAFGP